MDTPDDIIDEQVWDEELDVEETDDDLATNETDADALHEHHRIEVDKGQSLLRIDKFLAIKIPKVSRNKIQEAADADCILVNDIPVKQSYKVKPGDVVRIMMSKPKRKIHLIPQDIPLNIVYEDDTLLIVNKSPNMVVHPSYGHYTDTLVNAVAGHLRHLPMFGEAADTRPGLVHRIDKNTSGLLVVVKSDDARAHLSRQFLKHTIERKYIALVWGNFDTEQGTVTAHIGRHKKDRKLMAAYPDGSIGKHAVTHYRVLERFGYVTLIECKLETGRTHQIRAHMVLIGHPLFGDFEYGGDRILKGTTFTKYKQFVENCFKILPRQALHAKSLGFVHPATNEFVFFDSELPQDLTTVIERWRAYVSNRNDYTDN